MGSTWKCAQLLLVVTLALGVQSYKHNLVISKDTRQNFLIENFGFTNNGKMTMTVTNFALSPQVEDYSDDIYFLIMITDIEPPEQLTLNQDYHCPRSEDEFPSIMFISQNWDKEPSATPNVGERLYSLYFINCKSQPVSFHLYLEQYNVDTNGAKDYLPIGLSPIPTIYAMFSVVYAVMFVVWIFGYMRGTGKKPNIVHYLMSVLIVLKFFSMLFYAIEQHYVKIDGVPGGWQVAYYIFTVLKTLFFFVIITLIGTGWSFFKPFLSDRDKKIVMVVVPLQVLDNVAMVIVGSTAPGSVGWLTWKNIFRLVDIICCGAILIPIIWSIKHLREASQIDGKAARNLQKLRLFRQFYLIVVSYIYFTRIIIYLLDATLEYNLLYLGDVFTELATLCFFVVVGHKFRPVQGNPYFNLEEEDAARSEEMRTAAEED